MELDYPRDISIWRGVPYDVDAAFQYTDRKTYFFKGRHFWEFNDLRMAVASPEPTPINQHWMHCPRDIKDPFKSSVAMATAATATAWPMPLLFCSVMLSLARALSPCRCALPCTSTSVS